PSKPDTAHRHELGHGPHGGPVRGLRRAPGPRVRGRPAADGPSLLHQLAVAALRARVTGPWRPGPWAQAFLTFSSILKVLRDEPLKSRFRYLGRQRRSSVLRRVRVRSAIRISWVREQNR